jgi:hypothetical protein
MTKNSVLVNFELENKKPVLVIERCTVPVLSKGSLPALIEDVWNPSKNQIS